MQLFSLSLIADVSTGAALRIVGGGKSPGNLGGGKGTEYWKGAKFKPLSLQESKTPQGQGGWLKCV